jgi:hypothetical protein
MSFNNLTKIGEKGSDVYTAEGVGSALVALNTLLVRGVTKEAINQQMNAVSVLLPDDIWAVPALMCAYEDLWVLLFQNRDVRGGKGERASTTLMWEYMLEHHQEDALKMLPLLTEYGSWRDLFQLAALNQAVAAVVLELVEEQLAKDLAACAEGKPISLLAKWIPREDRQPELAKLIAKRLFPNESRPASRMKTYRKKISALNRVLKTTEVAMCSGDWASIEPKNVPGRCLQKNMKAFLNEPSNKQKFSSYRRGASLRYPDIDDRMECREHFQDFFKAAKEGKVTVKAANVVYPHEVVKKAMDSMRQTYHQYYGEETSADSSLSVDEKNGLLAQWSALVKDARDAGGLGRSLAMCDFSGSMQSSGRNGANPYWVSMAMGLLISEITTAEFRDTFLTFDSTPMLHRLPKDADLFARIAAIGHVGQGMSTDFQKAMDLVLGNLKASRCKPGDEPDNLIVITDMNWDAACASHQTSRYTAHSYRHVVKTSPWQTHIQMIREAFKRAGEDMWGVPFTPPRIVIWNVAATSSDFHAQADTEGVVMLSGWSPSLFKNLLKGEIKSMTPLEMLHIILEDERYDPVRNRLNRAMCE